MKRLSIFVILLILFFSATPTTNDNVDAKDTRHIDYNKNIMSYGELEVYEKGFKEKIRIIEFRDSEGCKYIISKSTSNNISYLQEKSNSSCKYNRTADNKK